MDFLKRNNWWLCLIISLLTFGLFYIFLAKFMKLYDKDAWYMNKWYWIIGGFFLMSTVVIMAIAENKLYEIIAAPFTLLFMLLIFSIQMNCKVASELKVSGSKIYNTPYTWIGCVIIPVVGWVILLVMWLYVIVLPNIKLADGYGEKYIK